MSGDDDPKKAQARRMLKSFVQWDPADEASALDHINVCLLQPDGGAVLVSALRDIAEVRGNVEIAEALAVEPDPTLGTVLSALKALGLRFRAEVA
jgi:DNA-binding phage protein